MKSLIELVQGYRQDQRNITGKLPGITYDVIENREDQSKAIVIKQWERVNGAATLNLDHLPEGINAIFVASEVRGGTKITGGRDELKAIYFTKIIKYGTTMAITAPAAIETHCEVADSVTITAKGDIALYGKTDERSRPTITTSGGQLFPNERSAVASRSAPQTTATSSTSSTPPSAPKRTRDAIMPDPEPAAKRHQDERPRDEPVTPATSSTDASPPKHPSPAPAAGPVINTNRPFFAAAKKRAAAARNAAANPVDPGKVQLLLQVPNVPGITRSTTEVTESDGGLSISTTTEFRRKRKRQKTSDTTTTTSSSSSAPPAIIPVSLPTDMVTLLAHIEERQRQAKERIRAARGRIFPGAREQQQEVLNDFFGSDDHKAVVVQPTGTGKTWLMTKKASTIIGENSLYPGKVLIIVPSDNLRNQTKDAFTKFEKKIRIALIGGKDNEKERNLDNVIDQVEVIITTSGMIERYLRPDAKFPIQFNRFDGVFFDEAHEEITLVDKVYDQIITAKAALLGFTATPEYNLKSTDRPHQNVYAAFRTTEETNPVRRTNYRQAVEKGSLAPVKCATIFSPVDLRKFRKRKNLELTENELIRHINTTQNNRLAIEAHFYGRDKHTQFPYRRLQAIVFCAGINHADSVAELYNKGDINEIDADKSHRLNYARNLIRDHFALGKHKRDLKNPAIVKSVIERLTKQAMHDFRIAAAVHYKSGKKAAAEEGEDTVEESGAVVSKKSAALIHQYKMGGILALTGADMLIEGFDHPATKLTINLRPTLSIPLAQQRGGRSGRLHRFDDTPLTEENFEDVIANDIRTNWPEPTGPSNAISRVLDFDYHLTKQIMFNRSLGNDQDGRPLMQCGNPDAIAIASNWEKNQVKAIKAWHEKHKVDEITKRGPMLSYEMSDEISVRFHEALGGLKPDGTGGQGNKEVSLVNIIHLFGEVNKQFEKMEQTAIALQTSLGIAKKIKAQTVRAPKKKETSPGLDVKRETPEPAPEPLIDQPHFTRSQQEECLHTIHEFTAKLRGITSAYSMVLKALRPESEEEEEDKKHTKSSTDEDKKEKLSGGGPSDLKRLMLAKASAASLLSVMEMMLDSSRKPKMKRGKNIGVIGTNDFDEEELVNFFKQFAQLTDDLVKTNKAISERSDQFLPPPPKPETPPPLDARFPHNEALMQAVLADDGQDHAAREKAITSLLKQGGINTAVPTASGKTILEAAIEHRDAGPLVLLLQHHCISHQGPGKNPEPTLHVMVEKYPHILPLIIGHDDTIDLNIKDNAGNTLIEKMAERGDENAVLMLRTVPAVNIQKLKNTGQYPLQIRAALAHEKVTLHTYDSRGYTRLEHYLETAPASLYIDKLSPYEKLYRSHEHKKLMHILVRKENVAGVVWVLTTITPYNNAQLLPGDTAFATPYERALASGSDASKQIARHFIAHRMKQLQQPGTQINADLLFGAIADHDRLSVDTILDMQPTLLISISNDGHSPLSKAAELGHTDMVQSFIGRSVYIGPEAGSAYSPLAIAARKNQHDIIMLMLHHAEKLTDKDWEDQTEDIEGYKCHVDDIKSSVFHEGKPLNHLIANHDVMAATKLISVAQDYLEISHTTLIMAIDRGVEENRGIIDILLNHKDVNIHALAGDGTNAYDHALQNGDEELIKILGSKGAVPSGVAVEQQLALIKDESKKLYAEKDYQGDLACHHRIVTLAPTAFHHYGRGRAHFIVRNLDLALDDFMSSGLKDPDSVKGNAASSYYIARIKGEQRDFAAAHQHINNAIALDSEQPKYYAYRGHLKAEQRDYEGASADFTKAHSLSQPCPLAHLYEAHSNIRQNKYEVAAWNLDSSPPVTTIEERSLAIIIRGHIETRKGNLVEREKLEDEALDLHPFNDNAYVFQSFNLFRLNKLPKAMASATKAIGLNPYNETAYMARSNIYLRLGDQVKSFADVEQAIILNPRNIGAYYQRAYVKKQFGDHIGVYQDYYVMAEVDPSEGHKKNFNDYKQQLIAKHIEVDSIPLPIVPLAAHKMQEIAALEKEIAEKADKNDHHGVIAAYTRLIPLQPDKIVHYLKSAASRLLVSDFAGAITDTTHGLERMEQNPNLLNNKNKSILYYTRAVAYGEQCYYDKAHSDLDKALKTGDPDDSMNRNAIVAYRGHLKSEIRQYTEAMTGFDAILARMPGDLITNVYRGEVLSHLNRYEEAATCLDSVIQAVAKIKIQAAIKPPIARALAMRGYIHALSGTEESAKLAEEYHQRAMNITKESDAVHVCHGNSLYTLKKYKDAQEAVTEALRLNNRNDSAHMLQGVIHEASGKTGNAKKWYDSAIAINGNNVNALIKRATLLERVASVNTDSASQIKTYSYAYIEYHRAQKIYATKNAQEGIERLEKIFAEKGVPLPELPSPVQQAASSSTAPVTWQGCKAEGEKQLSNQKFEAAISSFTKAFELLADDKEARSIIDEAVLPWKNAEILFSRAHAKGEMRRFAEAEADVKQAISYHSRITGLVPYLVHLHTVQCHFDTADKLFKKLPAYEKSSAEKQFYKAELELAKDNPTLAKTWLNEGMKHHDSPLRPRICAMNGYLRALNGEAKRADLYHLKAVNAMQPFTDDDMVHTYRAMSLHAMGSLNDAMVSAKQALKINPYNDVAHLIMGRLQESSDPQAAKASYDEAIRLNPRNAAAHDARKKLLENNGPSEIAGSDIEKAAFLGSKDYYNRAVLYNEYKITTHDNDSLSEAFRKVLSNSLLYSVTERGVIVAEPGNMQNRPAFLNACEALQEWMKDADPARMIDLKKTILKYAIIGGFEQMIPHFTADINTPDSHGYTMLQRLAKVSSHTRVDKAVGKEKHLQLMQRLITLGADPHLMTKNNETVATIAEAEANMALTNNDTHSLTLAQSIVALVRQHKQTQSVGLQPVTIPSARPADYQRSDNLAVNSPTRHISPGATGISPAAILAQRATSPTGHSQGKS